MQPEEQLELVTAIETSLVSETAEDPDRYKEVRLLRRLAVLHEELQGAARERYDALVARLGFYPDHPEFLVYVTGAWVGPTAPKSTNDLTQMGVGEIVEFVRSWEAPGDLMGPSPEGLSSSLSTVVANDPVRFVDEADQVADLQPIYARGVIDGLAQAVRESRKFDWTPVLELCGKFIDDLPEAPAGFFNIGSADQRRWLRQSIASLL